MNKDDKAINNTNYKTWTLIIQKIKILNKNKN